jgi:hypothetical protein
VFGFVCETEKADDALVDFFVFFKMIIFWQAKHDIVFKIVALQFSKDVPFPAFQTHGVSKVVPTKERGALHTDITEGLYLMIMSCI